MARYENREGSSILNWVLIAGGSYIVLKYFFGVDLLASVEALIAPGQPAPATGTGTTVGPTTNNQAVATLAAVMKAAQNDGTDPASYQSVDVWNVYFKMVRKVDGPGQDSIFPGDPTGKGYTINEYWNAMTKAGFSGMGMIGRGAYSQTFVPLRGQGSRPLGSERVRKMMI